MRAAQKTLTLYLGKADIEAFEDVFTEEATAKLASESATIVDAPDFGDGARLFVFVGGTHRPKWLTDVRRDFDVPDQIWTASAAGVLLFWSSGRLFASTFAHGWMYLDEHCFEGDFGLRAAINALDDKKLKRLERANLGDAKHAIENVSALYHEAGASDQAAKGTGLRDLVIDAMTAAIIAKVNRVKAE